MHESALAVFTCHPPFVSDSTGRWTVLMVPHDLLITQSQGLFLVLIQFNLLTTCDMPDSCAFSPLGFCDQPFYCFTYPSEMITSFLVSFAIFSSLAWTQHICVHIHVCSLLSCVQLVATPWTVAHQVPLSMEFSRQEYHSLPQEIFLTQGLNSDIIICKQGSTEPLSSPEKNLIRLQIYTLY